MIAAVSLPSSWMDRRHRARHATRTIGNQRRRHSHYPSSIHYCIVIVTIFLFQTCITNYYVHAFTTLQQQQQQQQSENSNNHIPTNHQQHHRSLSTTPFKATATAVTIDSFTTAPQRTVGTMTIPPVLSNAAVPSITDKKDLQPLPSLGFGGGVAVAPYSKEQEAVANYYHHQCQQHMMMMLQGQDDDDDDEALMGLGTALITCALSLVIGFSLGYGT